MRKLTAQEEEQLLNPDIRVTRIGKKKLRKLEILPLSLADQTKLVSAVSESFIAFYEAKDKSQVDFALVLKNEIERNLTKILSLATEEEGEKIIEEVTNVQLLDIIDLLFEMNFAILEKKVKEGSLLTKLKRMFGLAESTLKSSGDTPSTDLKISQENGSQKED